MTHTHYSGIIPPMITPLKFQDELDEGGLERLIEHILAGGVQGIFLLGTTGEAPSLSYRVRRELVQHACLQINGRVPIFVGITDTAFAESVNMARFAADCGATAVVLAPPYYFPAGQEELLEYLAHLAPELPLPLLLYNMPTHTKLIFEPKTVQRAMDIRNITGIKDSSGDMSYFRRLVTILGDRPDFSLLVGPEELLAETVLSGGHGGVCGGANLFPDLYVALYKAAIRGDRERVKTLHGIVMQVINSIYCAGRFSSSFIKGLKCALSLEGICADFVAEPFHRFREKERQQIAAALEQLKPTIKSLTKRI